MKEKVITEKLNDVKKEEKIIKEKNEIEKVEKKDETPVAKKSKRRNRTRRRRNKKNKKKNKNILGIILGIILLLITIIFFGLLKSLNIIPNKYFLIGAILVALITTNMVLILLTKPKKKHKGLKVIKKICYVVSILLILVYAFGTYYLNKTLHFIDNISVLTEEITNYYIIVLKDSKHKETSDLYMETLMYMDNTDKKVINSIKLDLKYSTASDTTILKEKFFNKEVEAILVSDITKNKLEEEVENFSETIRILETISIKNKIEDITKKVTIKNTPFNVLISGIDTYGNINQTSRNDVNIIATVNPNTNEILLTSIPRDYYVQLHGKEGYKDKLTHASYYGINTQVQTIEDIFDIDINYYVKVNFSTVVKLVDAIGGIKIYSDRYLYLYNGPCNVYKGYNNVNGNCALAFARERYAYSDGDLHRGRNQQEVIKAIFNKLSSGTTIVTKYTELLEVLKGKFATNMDMNEVLELVKYEVNDLPNYHIESTQVDGDGDMGKTYSYPNETLWIMIPNQDTIDAAKALMDKILNDKSIKESSN
ncbi:MAG: LCP family protein [Bacilli bacterium]|nr:LCP family protein [Bacilli bacterium]